MNRFRLADRSNRFAMWTVAVTSMLLLVVSLLLAACSDSGDNPVDPPVTVTISVDDETVTEGATALFDVSLSEATSHNVIFTYSTEDYSASAPGDYTATVGTDTIIAGTNLTTVIVPTVDDSQLEIAEVFFFKIRSVSGAVLGDTIGVGTLNDNEVPRARFSTDVRPILRGSCAIGGCHGVGVSQGGLTFGNATHAEVIAATGTNTVFLYADGLVVQPGDSGSTLYTKIKTGTDYRPPFGGQMPSGLQPLNETQQAKVRDWILDGALNN